MTKHGLRLWLLLWLLLWPGVALAQDIVTGRLACWHFNESAGATTAADDCGGFTGTLINMTPASDWVAGKIGNALNFDGVDASVDSSTSTTLSPPAITIAAWVQADAFPGPMTIVTRNAGGSAYYELTVTTGGKLIVYFGVSGGSGDISYEGNGSQTLTTGTWYHVATTYNSTAGLVSYVNGVVDRTITAAGTLNLISGVPTVIGRGAVSGQFFDGRLDEVYVFDRALTQADIIALRDLATGVRKRRSVLVY